MTKKTLFSFLSIFLFLSLIVSLFSCDTNSVDLDRIDPQEDGEIQDFIYKKNLKVFDETNNYYVVVSIESNQKKLVYEAIAKKPSINLEESLPFNADNKNTTTSLESQPDYNNEVLYKLTAERNIPKGKIFSFSMGKSDLISAKRNEKISSGCGIPGNTSVAATFQDDLATKVYTTNNSRCGILTKYYSKGCCWYSFGWYYRGERTLGTNNTLSYTFNATIHSPYKGVKVRATRYFDLNGLTWYAVN